MESSMSPQQYEERLFSIELDPPAEELIGTLVNLLAQSLADQRNIHRGKDTQAVSASDFLPPEPAEDSEHDEDDQPEQPVMPDAMIAFGARQRNMPLVMGHGSTLPSAALSAFFGKTGDEQ